MARMQTCASLFLLFVVVTPLLAWTDDDDWGGIDGSEVNVFSGLEETEVKRLFTDPSKHPSVLEEEKELFLSQPFEEDASPTPRPTPRFLSWPLGGPIAGGWPLFLGGLPGAKEQLAWSGLDDSYSEDSSSVTDDTEEGDSDAEGDVEEDSCIWSKKPYKPLRMSVFIEDYADPMVCHKVGKNKINYSCERREVYSKKKKRALRWAVKKLKKYIENTVAVVREKRPLKIKKESSCRSRQGHDYWTPDSRYRTHGIRGTDLHVFLFVRPCGKSETMIAGGRACQLNGNNRPVAGILHYCPQHLNKGRWSIYNTLRHEVFHILGADAWHRWGVSRNGGFKYRQVDYYPYGGSKPYKTTPRVGWKKMDGKWTGILKTPTVRDWARWHYGCQSAKGVFLENDGGSGTRHGYEAGVWHFVFPSIPFVLFRHWDKRYIGQEMMTGSGGTIISGATLAALYDTGWYQVNWYMQQPLGYGLKEGCQFLKDQCPVSKTDDAQRKMYTCKEATSLGKVGRLYKYRWRRRDTRAILSKLRGKIGCDQTYRGWGLCTSSDTSSSCTYRGTTVYGARCNLRQCKHYRSSVQCGWGKGASRDGRPVKYRGGRPVQWAAQLYEKRQREKWKGNKRVQVGSKCFMSSVNRIRGRPMLPVCFPQRCKVQIKSKWHTCDYKGGYLFPNKRKKKEKVWCPHSGALCAFKFKPSHKYGDD